MPAHASALGKATLAFTEGDVRDALSDDLRSMTGATITSFPQLEEQLDGIRTSGVATEVEESVVGECSLASPVFDSFDVVGAIGVVLPSGADLENHPGREQVRDAARAISREMGASAWPPAR